MNPRFAMIGMLLLLVLAGAAVIYFGTREPALRTPMPVGREPAKPVDKNTVAVPAKPKAPVPTERPALQRETAAPTQEGSAVEGMVVDKAGAPIAGASIHIGDTDTPEVARTGPDGRFTLASPPEAGASLTAAHPEYIPRTVAFTPGREKPARIAITLDKGGGIAGTVLRGGRPEPNVKVFVDRTEETTTDAEGQFAIGGLISASFVVHIELSDGASEGGPPPATWFSRKIEVREGETATADFDLPDCDSAVEGFVSFEGRPLAQASIALQVAHSRGEYHVDAETGADGGYHFASLPDGPATIRVSVSLANGAMRTKSAHFELKVHETVRQDFDFPVAGTVQGQVRGLRAGEHASVLALRGAPQQLGNMTAEQLLNMHEYVAANVDVASDGSFAFDAIDPGDYVIMITAGQPGSADFRSASQPVNVVAGADASVRIVMR